ncbi:hypothetical protein BC1002_0142 [Paraburkholderia atlantica]|uniref:Uncharacterized protein n=1 Tax=Paraburkholderia atlantica TaxID=2654982 RepID=D5WA28_PARAM|nr:hypothetical protein [Paraburkholderia atlantica]ADG14250.1 hypothetical protein BC1002_0142 [Paraburkholderia atlantica]
MDIAPKDPAALVLSALALAFSVFSLWFNFRSSLHAAMLSRKPVLVFEYDGREGWILRNIGNGPAMNVIVAQRLKTAKWVNPIRVPPLAKDGSLVLQWLGHVNTTGLGATYDDSENTKYTSTCRQDLTRVESGEKFGPWPDGEIGRHWDNPKCVT